MAEHPLHGSADGVVTDSGRARLADDLATIQAGLAELLGPSLTDRAAGRRRLTLATILLPDL